MRIFQADVKSPDRKSLVCSKEPERTPACLWWSEATYIMNPTLCSYGSTWTWCVHWCFNSGQWGASWQIQWYPWCKDVGAPCSSSQWLMPPIITQQRAMKGREYHLGRRWWTDFLKLNTRHNSRGALATGVSWTLNGPTVALVPKCLKMSVGFPEMSKAGQVPLWLHSPIDPRPLGL